MIIILFVFALIRTLHGVPLSSPSEDPDGLLVLHIRDTQVHFGQRGVNTILISCFATIFACTWSAVHPNIPAPTDCWWTRVKRQATTMVYALLAPEVITAWAMMQRLAARENAREYNASLAHCLNNSEHALPDRKSGSVLDAIRGLFYDSELPPALEESKGHQWTLTHGFFLQMGGFLLSEDGRPTQILAGESARDQESRIIWNIQNGRIDPPRLTEEDIKDRSKGDAISKTFIILQTTWFIVQCIARWSQRLPVTELEVVTLGFALLNGITYGLWWNKPQNVGRPVLLEIKKLRKASLEVPIKPSNTTNDLGAKDPKNLDEDAETSDTGCERTLPQPNIRKESWLRRKLCKETEERASAPWTLLWRVPIRLLVASIRPLNKMTGDFNSQYMAGSLRVGMFYTAFDGNARVDEAMMATAAIGTLFGVVHLVPSWFLAFASPQEKWLWRVSAIVITVEPISMGCWCYFMPVGGVSLHGIIGVCIAGPCYIISRIILLTLSLTSLRSLPSGALQTIEWTTFIPHL
ncbi:hypothetical protein BJ912DRAFT_1141829 [Pholiota molesta]|nr:hypothetical protein BJ912DRAFT_1141829 [Pholiota molesta]